MSAQSAATETRSYVAQTELRLDAAAKVSRSTLRIA